MKNNKALPLILLAFVLLLGGAYLLYNKLGQNLPTDQLMVQGNASTQAPTEPTETEENTTGNSETTSPPQVLAPDFTVYDRDGNPVHLSDFRGKPVVLNFWASWCPPCKMEMPDFQERYLEFGENVHFLMVNSTDGSRETVETASGFIQELGYTFPVFFDTLSDAAMKYGTYSLPTTFFIDAQGYAVAQATGMLDAATLQRGIDMIYRP